MTVYFEIQVRKLSRTKMILNIGDFNIREIIDSQQLNGVLAETANVNPANTVGNGEASQMLDILRELRSDMQSMNSQIANLEQSQGPRETETPCVLDPSERWANHMEGLPVPMYAEPQYEDEEEDVDKENTQGTKLFAVSSERRLSSSNTLPGGWTTQPANSGARGTERLVCIRQHVPKWTRF